MEYYSKFCNKVTADKCENYIIGDFNINLLNHANHPETETFINSMMQYHQYPVIDKPTRFGLNTSTLIDNIFANNFSEEYYAGLIVTDLSDHLPIFYISRKACIHSKVWQPCKYFRDIKYSAIQQFSHELKMTDWSALHNISNADDYYDKFLGIVQPMYDNYFPLHFGAN
jgi:hypothetical protein